MAHGRWYPTVTTLPDGRMLTMAGRDENGNVVEIPEIWEGNQWVELPGGAGTVIPYYPRNFVAPDGRIFMAGCGELLEELGYPSCAVFDLYRGKEGDKMPCGHLKRYRRR